MALITSRVFLFLFIYLFFYVREIGEIQKT